MPISFRQASEEDDFATFNVFLKSIIDYSERTGVEGA